MTPFKNEEMKQCAIVYVAKLKSVNTFDKMH